MLEAALTFTDKTSGEQSGFSSLCGQRGFLHKHKGFEFKDKAFVPRGAKSTEILHLSWSGCSRFCFIKSQAVWPHTWVQKFGQ